MKTYLPIVLAVSTAFSSTTVFAGKSSETQDYDHFKGKEAGSYDAALTLFKQYNEKVEALINKDKLSYGDMHNIHEYTYTIENALAKINQEMNALAEQLETLHKASETAKSDSALAAGRTYIENAKRLVK
mgnify:CR=1 FL=1